MDWYIQAIYAPLILIFGLSHLTQPRLTADFFIAMKRTGFAPLIIGMYTLPTGLILIVGHNKWVLDWPLFITLSGWAMTLKSIVYLVFPGTPDRLVTEPERLLDRHAWVFRVAGLILVVFGGILTWQAFVERSTHP
jgi:hypothetical protein